MIITDEIMNHIISEYYKELDVTPDVARRVLAIILTHLDTMEYDDGYKPRLTRDIIKEFGDIGYRHKNSEGLEQMVCYEILGESLLEKFLELIIQDLKLKIK